LNPYRTSDQYPRPAFLLDYVSIPAKVKDLICSLKPVNDDLNGLRADQVLNREIVEKYTSK